LLAIQKNNISLSEKKQLLLLHISLGLISTISIIPLILWLYYHLMKAFREINKWRISNYFYFLFYIGPFEILARMSRTSPFVPYEFGKYVTFLVLVIGIFKMKKRNTAGFVGLLLFLPGILIMSSATNWRYQDFVFNGLGLVNTFLGLIFFSNSLNDRFVLFRALENLVYPILSILAYTILKAPSFEEASFELGANFDFTGGFGSNQISTVYGLAIFSLFLVWYYKRSFTGYGISADLGLLGVFVLYNLISFSRGGFIGGLLGILIIVLFAKEIQKQRQKQKIGSLFLWIIPLFLTVIFQVNAITKGKLFLRYQGETYGTQFGKKENDLNNLTTGRLEIFLEDVMVWINNPIFGVGIGQSRYERVNSMNIVSHVEAGRLLSEHGILGLLIIFMLVYFIIKSGLRAIRLGGIYALIFALYTIGFFTTFHSATRTFVSPLLMSLVFIKRK